MMSNEYADSLMSAYSFFKIKPRQTRPDQPRVPGDTPMNHLNRRKAECALYGLAALLLLGFAGSGHAGEAYFVMVFSSQQSPNRPNHAHCFATFIKATGPRATLPGSRLEAHTISWLPENLVIRAWAIRPEYGHNLGLHETLRHASDNGERVSLWGPYRIDKDLYDRALEQIDLLESGNVLYKAIDAGYSTDSVSNCIHAVSSIVDGHRLRVLSPGWGELAGFYIKERFEPWIVDEERTYDWVARALGLEKYPITYRDKNLRSSAFRSPLPRLPLLAAKPFLGLVVPDDHSFLRVPR
jgi:hypothetical protein